MERRAKACECNTLDKAVTCSFLGHSELYDLGLFNRIKQTLYSIVRKNGKIEFLFQNDYHPFYFLCLAAVLEAKARFSHKSVTITFIGEKNELPDRWLNILRGHLFPPCVFDRQIVLPTTDGTKFVQEWKKTDREIIRLSDYLICYVYPDLGDSFNDLYKFAVRQSKTTLLNLADTETVQFIRESVTQLNTIQQYIINELKNGKSYSSIGKALGITGQGARGKDHKGRKLLRTLAREHFNQQCAADGPIPPAACTVLMPNTADKLTPEEEDIFKGIIYFLMRQLHVSTFLVEQNNVYSSYVRLLRRITEGAVRIVVATHFITPELVDWESVIHRYVPPYDEVLNIDPQVKMRRAQYFRTLDAIMMRSEYIVCKLGAAYSKNVGLEKKIAKHKHLKIFDLSNPQELIILNDGRELSGLY